MQVRALLVAPLLTMSKYDKVEHDAGRFSDWWTPPAKGHRLACCHCHLVHDVEFRVLLGGKEVDLRTVTIQIRMRVNDRATSAMRRKNKPTLPYEKIQICLQDRS
jgi:hypothetical protein